MYKLNNHGFETKKPIKLHGQNGLQINPIHVKDAANAVIATLECEIGHTFNIAGNEIYNLRKISNMIGDLLNIRPIFETNSNNPSDIFADNSLMRKHLCDPEIGLQKGLEDLL